jgi:hypothetical protein
MYKEKEIYEYIIDQTTYRDCGGKHGHHKRLVLNQHVHRNKDQKFRFAIVEPIYDKNYKYTIIRRLGPISQSKKEKTVNGKEA